jgi:hypothetical protein
MLKDFFKKIQSLEEGERRHILGLLTIVATVFVSVLWINQIKSIFESQTALNRKKTAGATLPSIKENIKSTAGELGQIISGFNSRLKSRIFPEELEITPSPNPVQALPPAVKLPE